MYSCGDVVSQISRNKISCSIVNHNHQSCRLNYRLSIFGPLFLLPWVFFYPSIAEITNKFIIPLCDLLWPQTSTLGWERIKIKKLELWNKRSINPLGRDPGRIKQGAILKHWSQDKAVPVSSWGTPYCLNILIHWHSVKCV